MAKLLEEMKLQDGTLIRHKVVGYEGRIDGITQIRNCFTAGGAVLRTTSSGGQTFQYRVVIEGESMRRIAPAEDLEILEAGALVICLQCGYSFQSRPGLESKPGGRCQCGGWICPACLSCRGENSGTDKAKTPVCAKQRARQTRKLAAARKRSRNG